MNIGSFTLRVIECGSGFRAECDFAGTHLWPGIPCPTQKEALDRGIRILEEQFQRCLNDLKPKYQTKSRPVDAMQWRGVVIDGISIDFGKCYYYGLPIKPGDWIIDGKVVTNEQFEQDYEVVQ